MPNTTDEYYNPFDYDDVVALVSPDVLEELEDLRTFLWLVTESYWSNFIYHDWTLTESEREYLFRLRLSRLLCDGFGV